MEVALGWHILKIAGRRDHLAQRRHRRLSHLHGLQLAHARRHRRPVEHVLRQPASTTSAAICSTPRCQLTQSPPPAAKARTADDLDAAVFDRYVGRYQLAPADAHYHQTRRQPVPRAAHRSARSSRSSRRATRSSSGRWSNAQLTFETDAQNKVTAVVLHQNGVDQRSPRIEGEPIMPTKIAVAPDVLERYTGRYQLTPDLIFTITRQDTRLFAQLTGQPMFEVYPIQRTRVLLHRRQRQTRLRIRRLRPHQRRRPPPERPNATRAADRVGVDAARLRLRREIGVYRIHASVAARARDFSGHPATERISRGSRDGCASPGARFGECPPVAAPRSRWPWRCDPDAQSET